MIFFKGLSKKNFWKVIKNNPICNKYDFLRGVFQKFLKVIKNKPICNKYDFLRGVFQKIFESNKK